MKNEIIDKLKNARYITSTDDSQAIASALGIEPGGIDNFIIKVYEVHDDSSQEDEYITYVTTEEAAAAINDHKNIIIDLEGAFVFPTFCTVDEGDVIIQGLIYDDEDDNFVALYLTGNESSTLVVVVDKIKSDGGSYTKYEVSESEIMQQDVLGYIYTNTPDCIVVHTNKGAEQHYMRMYDVLYACIIGETLCTFEIGLDEETYQPAVQQYDLSLLKESLNIEIQYNNEQWTTTATASDIREAFEDGVPIKLLIGSAVIDTTARADENGDKSVVGTIIDYENSIMMVFVVSSSGGNVGVNCYQYTLTPVSS